MDPALSDPKRFVRQLVKNTRNGDADAEADLFDCLDFELQSAIKSAGEAVLCGKKVTSLAKWLEFMIRAVRFTAQEDASLKHFEWHSKGKEAFGGKLLRRLYGVCGSSSYDAVKVTVPDKLPPVGLVLLVGKGGGNLDDLAPIASWWNAKQYTCIQAVKVGWDEHLLGCQVTKILTELVKHNVGSLGLISHIFSENGFTLWGLVMKQWLASPQKDLPPLQQALRGCVYDSCSSYGVAATQSNSDTLDFVPTVVRHVLLRSIVALASRDLSPDSDCMNDLSTDGAIAQGAQAWYGCRGLQDCPVFFDYMKTWFELAQFEPPAIPRICFYSETDMSVGADGIRATAEWSKSVRGNEIEMVHFEKTEHCRHHELDDGKIYFGRLDNWLSLLNPNSNPAKTESDSAPASVKTEKTTENKPPPGSSLDGPGLPVWEVVGGGDKGGILVREGEDLKSPACGERLASGSLVEELALIGQRLHYKILSGSGPNEGWISLKVAGKDLVIPKASPDAAAGA
mmetsp:Transcript_72895/g.126578  ORF Transcript_72895/g.126578 Transcript_72895/m.126578 type:complete len:511 (-) Transcript_72895:85-1617(-)